MVMVAVVPTVRAAEDDDEDDNGARGAVELDTSVKADGGEVEAVGRPPGAVGAVGDVGEAAVVVAAVLFDAVGAVIVDGRVAAVSVAAVAVAVAVVVAVSVAVSVVVAVSVAPPPRTQHSQASTDTAVTGGR